MIITTITQNIREISTNTHNEPKRKKDKGQGMMLYQPKWMSGFGFMHFEKAAKLDVFQYSMHVLWKVYTPMSLDYIQGKLEIIGFPLW